MSLFGHHIKTKTLCSRSGVTHTSETGMRCSRLQFPAPSGSPGQEALSFTGLQGSAFFLLLELLFSSASALVRDWGCLHGAPPGLPLPSELGYRALPLPHLDLVCDTAKDVQGSPLLPSCTMPAVQSPCGIPRNSISYGKQRPKHSYTRR